MNFVDVPLELKLAILSYLSQKDLFTIARVCRSLRDAAYHPSLWKTVKVDAERGMFVDSFASFALKSGALLQELEVRLNSSGESQRLFTVLPHLATLKSLKLYFQQKAGDWVTESITEKALLRFPNIESLLIVSNGRYFVGSGIPVMETLKHLEIHCIEPNSTLPLLEKCILLETILVKKLRSLSFWQGPSTFITYVGRFCQTLTRVELTNVSIKGELLFCLKECTGLTVLKIIVVTNLADEHFMVLKCFPYLTRLVLTFLDSHSLTKRAVMQLFSESAMKNLQLLLLPEMRVDEECVKSITQCCPNLEDVSLFCTGDKEICRAILKEECKNLKNVNLL